MTVHVSPRRFSGKYRVAGGLVVALALGSVWSLQTAFAQKEKTPATPEAHSREVTSLKQAFGSSTVDLFFEMGELELLKPGLSGVKLVDAVDVTGKELLRFERSGDSWLIDPDTVFAYHLHKAK